jgi:SAM-dependent methyltransferase
MSLTEQDRATLELVLRNEADMAFRRRTIRLFDWLDLQDGDSILDCGCGMGFQLMALRSLRRLRLTGVDLDLHRLQRAAREVSNAMLARCDVQELPFASSVFDKALMTEVLEHVKDDWAALRSVFRVLRPGGTLAISVPHARYPFLWDPINAVWTRIGGSPITGNHPAGIWSGHARLYHPDRLAHLVRAAGFEVESVEEATHYCFPLTHFILYSIGKPLIERNLLPQRLHESADRFSGPRNRAALLNPINVGLAVFRSIDRLNDTPRAQKQRTFVNVLLLARKPY